MKKIFSDFHRILYCLVLFLFFGYAAHAQELKPDSHNYVFNRQPLAMNAYAELPIGSIQAQGWLKVQLQKMAEGMAGKLGKLYPDVGPNNAWRGGNGDSWERGPYYLDGLVPLAYILKDDSLIRVTKKWINWIINSQQSNGYFGPKPNPGARDTVRGIQITNKGDWWPRMLVMKAMESYYSATRDPRVIPFMTKYFEYQLKTLPEKPMGYWTWWAKARGGENLQSVYWLYNRTGNPDLLRLARIIHVQSMDWADGFLSENLPSTHGVNVAMAIKYPALYFQQSKQPRDLEAVNKGWSDLMKYDGVVQGVFTSDEMLHGKNPTNGTELCTVVETMYSLENIIRITGDLKYADALERVAFNALPAQVTAAYSGRQYFQQANQVLIKQARMNFSTAYQNAVCFGLLTGYPCCTVNMHQGWPKFTRNLWMATPDNGLIAMLYSTNSVTAKVADGQSVTIDESTDYPFRGSVDLVVHTPKKTLFPLYLRIPGWADQATIRINGRMYSTAKGGKSVGIRRLWSDGDRIEMQLPMKIRTDRWYENSVGVERGPLVFALKLPGKWQKIGEVHTVPVWGVKPDRPWNYGLILNGRDPGSSFSVKIARHIPTYPWTLKNAPVTLKVDAKQIPNWTLYDNYAGPLPYSPVQVFGEKTEQVELVPYGSTTLRISEFPEITHN